LKKGIPCVKDATKTEVKKGTCEISDDDDLCVLPVVGSKRESPGTADTQSLKRQKINVA
jgi:hypothetical protein